MKRKLSKAELDEFQKTTGVRVKYQQKPAMVDESLSPGAVKQLKPQAQQQPMEVVLTIPEDLLKPLMDVIGRLFEAQQQTQDMISMALSRSIPGLEITERDHQGNIKHVSFDKPVTH